MVLSEFTSCENVECETSQSEEIHANKLKVLFFLLFSESFKLDN